jgi:hypothetical protein
MAFRQKSLMSQTSPNSPVSESAKPSATSAVAAPFATAVANAELPPDENDPLAHLYKMSRTAGLGSGDYVAINTVAVVSLVFGIAGALVVVDSLFIVLPLVGLILGIIAFRQVRQSNGTQSGAGMAGLAMLLSIAFLGGKVGKEEIDYLRRRADKKEIVAMISTFGQDISQIEPANPDATNSHLASAYDMFDEAFKSRVSLKQFESLWISTLQSPYYGPMVSMYSNDLLKFDVDPKSGDEVCTSIAIAEFKRGEAPRWAMNFRQLNDKWYIEDMPEVFPAAPAQQQQQRR